MRLKLAMAENSRSAPKTRLWFRGNALPHGFFAIKLLIHLLLIGRYGYHGDELYFIECGKHIALGYVDQGPWVPWVARLSRAGQLSWRGPWLDANQDGRFQQF